MGYIEVLNDAIREQPAGSDRYSAVSGANKSSYIASEFQDYTTSNVQLEQLASKKGQLKEVNERGAVEVLSSKAREEKITEEEEKPQQSKAEQRVKTVPADDRMQSAPIPV